MNGFGKKYPGSDIGRVNGTGVALEFPEFDVGTISCYRRTGN